MSHYNITIVTDIPSLIPDINKLTFPRSLSSHLVERLPEGDLCLDEGGVVPRVLVVLNLPRVGLAGGEAVGFGRALRV